MGRKRRDWVGERFGSLVVIGYSEKEPSASGYLYLVCQCDCGNSREVSGERLTSKNKYAVTSCKACSSKQTRNSHRLRAEREEAEAREESKSRRRQLIGQFPEKWFDLPLTKKHADEHGAATYFNGKQCINGHLSPSWANSHQCCECSRVRLAEWRESDEGKEWQGQYAKARWQDPEERKKGLEARRKWAKENPERLKELRCESYYRNWESIRKKTVKRWRERYQTDPAFRLRCTVARRIHHVLKDQDVEKSRRSLEYLGCSAKELKVYLEGLFKDGMSWDNYGQFGWHVDHIRPCSSFDLSDEKQAAACFHYSNLQPMWWRENIVKGGEWEEDDDRFNLELTDDELGELDDPQYQAPSH